MYNTDMPTRAELPSSAKLLRSTISAIVIAAILLVTVVLPSEYGIDPTGAGKALGLKAMGEIKTQLAAEAAADAEADQRAAAPAAGPAAVAVIAPADTTPRAADGASSALTVTLAPGAATEVKMDMRKGETVRYAWSTDGAKVNHDTHGEPAGGPANAFHRYLKEVDVTANSGEFTAAFDGSHGWFWRNRSDKPATITLKVSGQFKNLKQKA